MVRNDDESAFDSGIFRWFGKNFMFVILISGVGYVGTISSSLNDRLKTIEKTLQGIDVNDMETRKDIEYLKINDQWQDEQIKEYDLRLRAIERNHPNSN